MARTTGRDLDEVAAVYFLLSERFRVDDLLSKISRLPREDRWQTLARMALRYDLYAALAALTAEVLAAAGPELSAEEQVHEWEPANASGIARTRKAIGEFDEAAGRPRHALGAAASDPHPGARLRRPHVPLTATTTR